MGGNFVFQLILHLNDQLRIRDNERELEAVVGIFHFIDAVMKYFCIVVSF